MGKTKKGKPSEASTTNSPASSTQDCKKKKFRPNNFERAKAVFDRIQEEKLKAREKKLQEREKRQKALDNYLTNKKKMNKAVGKKTRKGQPNLGAQVAVLLEKLQEKG